MAKTKNTSGASWRNRIIGEGIVAAEKLVANYRDGSTALRDVHEFRASSGSVRLNSHRGAAD